MKCGAEVVELPEESTLRRRIPHLIRAIRLANQRNYNRVIILVSFPGYRDAIAASVISKLTRVRVLFDPFFGLVETFVDDKKTVPKASMRHLYLVALEFLSFKLVDTVFVDTNAHGEYFHRRRYLRRSKIVRLPVTSLQQEMSHDYARHHEDCTLVLWYGNYIPLQGAENIIEAAANLDPGILIRMIGNGKQRDSLQERAKSLHLKNIEFHDHAPYETLRQEIASADIVLGIFSTGNKAGRVVPNKVVDALSEGKPLISADTIAMNEILLPHVEFVPVPAGDGLAIARTINELALDAARRAELGVAARRRFELSFSDEAACETLRLALHIGS